MNKIIVCLSLAMLASGAVCQDEFIPDKGQTPAKEEPKRDDPEKELKEKIKKYDDFLKDTTKLDGPFTLYTKKKDGKTDVFLELDPAQLGKYWFLEATLRTGGNAMGLQAGEPANTMMNVDAYRFERKADQIWLMVPNLSWRWHKDSPWATAARRSFPEGVIDEYKIEAEHPTTKKMVIKTTDLFYGGVLDLNERVSGTMMRPYILDRGKSGVSDVKTFPENIVVRADLFFNSPSRGGGMPEGLAEMLGFGGKSHLADDRSLPLGVTYLIYPQKDNGYVPRIADARVGYFTQDFFDHSKLMELDKTTRYINRWNLKRKDANAAMSEPVKPIVWYIDDSVPEKYRKACAEGILLWNKAFEKIGYKNAILVKMKPKDADWDHADMRYNVLRVIQSEAAGYAVASARSDPFTGEIVNAGISVDASVIGAVGQEYTWLTAPARGAYSESLAKLVHRGEETPAAKAGPWKKLECRLGKGKLESAAFAWSALETLMPLGTSINKDEYLKEFLVDLVSHEAGHCLGLRHNFVASTYMTDEQLANPGVTSAQGTSASVMDYMPVNIAAVAKGKGHFYTRSIGSYDVFAIEYGYKDVPGNTALGEKPHLVKIAKQGSLPGHLYMTDENADAFDPYVVRFDNSKDPIRNAGMTISVAKKLLAKADKNYPKPGRPYSDLTRVVNMAIMQTARQCFSVARFVGGLAGRRNFAGDPGEKPTLAPVEPALQRAAIQLIARELLSETSFQLSKRMLVNLSGDSEGRYSDAPIKDIITMIQSAVVSSLLSADTTERVANSAFKLAGGKDRFTLSELYSIVVGSVFSEVAARKPIGMLRRDLQRFVVDALSTQALARPGSIEEDVRMLAWHHLRGLSKKLAGGSKEEMTSMHQADLRRRIERTEKSVVTSGG